MSDIHYKKQDVLRIIRAIKHSLHGFSAAWKNEQAFRQEIILGIILAPILCFMSISFEKKAILVAAFIFLLIVELLNSAIEALSDRVSYDPHHLIKNAKDMSSAAVLLAIVLNIIAWIICL